MINTEILRKNADIVLLQEAVTLEFGFKKKLYIHGLKSHYEIYF